MADNEQTEEQQHPALKSFSKVTEMVKHVVKKTFGFGMKGVMIGAIALPALAVFGLGGALAGIPVVGSLLAVGSGAAAIGSATGQGVLLGLAIKGAMVGAGLGAASGAISGITGAEDAAEEASQSAIIKWDKHQQQAANQKLMDYNRQQLAAMRQAPVMPMNSNMNAGLPTMQRGGPGTPQMQM